MLLSLGGCSLMLDPTDCSSDSECSNGTCVSGICVSDPIEPDMMIIVADMAEVDMVVALDMASPDMLAPDAMVEPDMTMLPPDMMVNNQPPVCRISADETLVGEAEVRLILQVTDEDNEVGDLEVTFNETPITLNEDGLYEGVFLLEEGPNEFRLVAVSNGQNCADSIVVTSDQTAPRIIDERPSIGETLKSGNGRVFVTATVIEEHFSPILSIFVNGMPYEIAAEDIDWNEQTYILELDLERGLHDVEVLVTDQVGNISRSAVGRDCSVDSCVHSFIVDVDSEPPTIELDTLLLDAVNRIPGNSVQLVGTVIDDGLPVPMAIMQVTVSPEAGSEQVIALRTDNDGRFNQSIDVLNPNSSTASIELCAEDVSTNRGCITIEVEKQLPCVEIVTPQPNVIFPSPSVNVSGTICDGVDRLEFRLNGTSVNFKGMFSGFAQR